MVGNKEEERKKRVYVVERPDIRSIERVYSWVYSIKKRRIKEGGRRNKRKKVMVCLKICIVSVCYTDAAECEI